MSIIEKVDFYKIRIDYLPKVDNSFSMAFCKAAHQNQQKQKTPNILTGL
jgi:hypothetical protein